MQAAVVTRYGDPDVVEVVARPDPRPKADEVLVRVHSVAVSSGDARIRAARFPPGFGAVARLAVGLRGPRRPVLGGAVAGVVEACGAKVTGLAPGDRVAGMTGLRLGGHAELVAVRAGRLAPTPPDVSDDDAAAVLFGGTTALHFLARATIGEGTTVLVNGAAGAIGTNAVQLARQAGATVTGVCGPANAALVEDLGADHVIDHTVEDVATTAERFDVVLDCVGTISIAAGRRLLNPGGTLLLAVAGLGETIRARGDVVAGPAGERIEDVTRLLDLVATGDLAVVIDDVLPLDRIADAHTRVDSGHKVGNILVRP